MRERSGGGRCRGAKGPSRAHYLARGDQICADMSAPMAEFWGVFDEAVILGQLSATRL